MRIQLNIETNNPHLGFDIASANNMLTVGTVVDVPGGAKIVFQGSEFYKSFDIPHVLQFIVDAAINVEVNLLSAWLYDKVKGKSVKRIIINRQIITEISEQGIRQVLEEEIRSSSSE